MIAKGTLVNQNDAEVYSYRIIRLSSIHQLDVLRLQDEVCQRLSDKASYQPMEEWELNRLLTDKGIIYGVVVEHQLVGCSALYFPGQADDNLALDLPHLIKNLNQVFHLEAVMIHPHFRGNQLQKTLFLHMLHFIKESTNYRYAYSTVSPHNIPSLKSLLSLELLVAERKIKYNNSERYILYQDLFEPVQMDTKDTIVIPILDRDNQISHLKNNYYGIKFIEQHSNPSIVFGKMMRW